MAISRNIHREQIKAVIAENRLASARGSMEHTLTTGMRDSGYVPSLDLDTLWVCEYDPETENYNCELTMYFLYVGKKKAWTTQGVSSGKIIPTSTPQVKSEPS